MIFTILFSILILAGFFLFIIGQRVWSIIILFFFITDGYQLLPLEEMKLTSTSDFAIAQSLLIFLFYIFVKKSINFKEKDLINKAIKYLTIILIIIILINILVLKISPIDCIVTLRPLLFLTTFYFLSFVSKNEFDLLKQIFLGITVVQSVLFIIQVFTNIQLLNGYYGGEYLDLGFVIIPRCYNFPLFLPYFLFQVYFSNMKKGPLLLGLQILFPLTILLPQHRSMIGVLIVLFLYGILVKRGSLIKSLKYIAIFVVFFFLLKSVLSERFNAGNISDDIEQVFTGSFEDFDLEKDAESTMFYRVAMLTERLFYISERPITALFGGGLMRESSAQANQLNFFVIYFDPDTNTDYMVSTPDIAWSMIVFRLGLIGSIGFILFYSSLTSFFLKKRKESDFSFATHIFMLFLLLTSFTGSDLFKIWPFILPLLDYIMIKKVLAQTEPNDQPAINSLIDK